MCAGERSVAAHAPCADRDAATACAPIRVIDRRLAEASKPAAGARVLTPAALIDAAAVE